MLKKIVAAVLAFFVLIAVWVLNTTPVLGSYSKRLELYISENSSTATILSISTDDFSFIRNVCGESCEVEKENFSVERFFNDLQAEVLFVEKTEFGTSYYGFTDKIKYRKTFNGETVNVHVAVSESKVTIGTPIIFGSF